MIAGIEMLDRSFPPFPNHCRGEISKDRLSCADLRFFGCLLCLPWNKCLDGPGHLAEGGDTRLPLQSQVKEAK